MGVLSGVLMAINGEPGVRNWNITIGQSQPSFVASNTGGGTSRLSGVEDWSGSYSALGHTPSVMPGETFTFDGMAGEEATPANSPIYTGQAIVDSIAVTWDFATNAPISHVVNFSRDGDLTQSTGSYADATADDPDYPCGKLVKKGAVEIENITQAVLTITAANLPYVNSSTLCKTRRKPGNIDWTLALTLQEAELDAVGAPGTTGMYSLEVNSTPDKWAMQTGIVVNNSNLNVDRESGAIISFTHNIAMVAIVPTAGYIGYIKRPGETVTPWWGEDH